MTAVTSFAIGLTAISVGMATPGFSATEIKPTAEHVPGEMVVKVRQGAGLNSLASVRSLFQRKLGNTSVLAVEQFKTDDSLFVVKVARDNELNSAIKMLKTDSAIEIAEPNFIYRASDTAPGIPNDADFAKLWGMKNTGQADSSGQVGTVGSDIKATQLWAEGITGNKAITVSVIDTGVDWTHPDLVDNLYTNLGEIPDNGIDDDGNGFVDDVHGWNFAAKTKNSNDDHGHGSHCSGTIGGKGNNGIGVAGVNWDVTIMPVKFLDAGGSGTLQAAVEAINYSRMMKVNIMSNSWGGGGYSEALKQAIVAAKDANILFVAAAGNESNNNDASPTYPAAYDVSNVVAVAATDNKDAIAYFSNYGTRTVHVAAPGVRIFSTVKAGGYDTYSGTSMACPHVAGVAALMMSHDNTLSLADIKNRLITTSDRVPGLKRKVMAKGRVNAYNAIHNIVPPSNEPDPSLWRDMPMTVESEHPYKDKQNLTFPISVPGAKFIRVHFEKIEVENRYDTVSIEKGTGGEVMDSMTGTVNDYTTEYVEGDSVTIRLKSDTSVNGYGFKVDRVQYIPGDAL